MTRLSGNMASISGKLRMLRRARQEVAPPPTTHFDAYQPVYRDILVSIQSILGDGGLNELSDWMEQYTKRTGSLPSPEQVRSQARDMCEDQGIAAPADLQQTDDAVD